MSIFELVGFLLMLLFVTLASRELGRVLAVPQLLLVVPLIFFLVLVLQTWKKVPARTLFVLSGLLIVAIYLSMAVAYALSLREPILVTPVAAGIIFIAIQSKLFARDRQNPSKHE